MEELPADHPGGIEYHFSFPYFCPNISVTAFPVQLQWTFGLSGATKQVAARPRRAGQKRPLVGLGGRDTGGTKERHKSSEDC